MKELNISNFEMLTAEIDGLKLTVSYDNDFFDTEKEWNVGSHYHNIFECHYIFSNSTELVINGNPILLNSRDFCIIPPHHTHYIRKSETKARKCSFLFSIDKVDMSKKNKIFDYYNKVWSEVSEVKIFHDSNAYENLFKPVTMMLTEDTIYSHLNRKLLFLSFFIDMTRRISEINAGINPENTEYSSETKNTNEYRLMVIEQYLQKHFTENINSSDIAKQLHMSKRQTERIIRKLTGASCSDLINNLRLNKAAELLSYSHMSIEKIVDSIGYSSCSTFYKRFLRKYNQSPSEYRKNINIH